MHNSSRRILLKTLLPTLMSRYLQRKEWSKTNQKLLVLFSTFSMLNIVDTVTTYIGLASRKATEINPFHENLNFEGISVSFVLVKNVVLPFLLLALSHTALKRVCGHYRIPYYVILVVIIVYYGFVVGNNLMVLG